MGDRPFIGLYTEKDKQVEQEILNMLSVRGEARPAELLDVIPFVCDVPRNSIREAIWRLERRHEIELTQKLRVRLVKSHAE